MENTAGEWAKVNVDGVSGYVNKDYIDTTHLYRVAESPEEEAAMELVQHAPTARNTQKVVFSFFGDRITAGVPDDAPFDLVDLGICKLHFEIGMRELFPQCRFAWGNGGTFNPAA